MPEIVADNISIIQSAELEETMRIEAEYYQPKYLKVESQLMEYAIEDFGNLVREIRCGPFGSTILADTYIENGVIVARPFNIKNYSLEYENHVFIDEEDCLKKNLKFYSEGDLFFSRVGDVRCGVVPKFNQKITISPNIIAVKIDRNRLNPYYAVIFFNSKYGFPQIERAQKVVAQPTISTDLIKNLKIVLFSKDFQSSIEDNFSSFFKLYRKSSSLYSQAESRFLEELGIKAIDLSHDHCCEVNSADTILANRIDAEYYQVKYETIIKKIKKNPYKAIGDMFCLVKGIEPGSSVYCEKGKPFIRVSNLNKFEINNNNQQYLSEETYSALASQYQPLKGEILLSKDATPGIAYHLKEQMEGIISGGILRLQALSDINKEYVCLVVNSFLGQAQIERDSGGSVINHWKPVQVKNMLIPFLSAKVQDEIENLCLESFSARRQAKELLEKAKRKVEEMIEKCPE